MQKQEIEGKKRTAKWRNSINSAKSHDLFNSIVRQSFHFNPVTVIIMVSNRSGKVDAQSNGSDVVNNVGRVKGQTWLNVEHWINTMNDQDCFLRRQEWLGVYDPIQWVYTLHGGVAKSQPSMVKVCQSNGYYFEGVIHTPQREQEWWSVNFLMIQYAHAYSKPTVQQSNMDAWLKVNERWKVQYTMRHNGFRPFIL